MCIVHSESFLFLSRVGVSSCLVISSGTCIGRIFHDICNSSIMVKTELGKEALLKRTKQAPIRMFEISDAAAETIHAVPNVSHSCY